MWDAALKLAVLGLTGAALYQAVAATPIADAALRAAAPGGDWRTKRVSTLFDPGRYLQEQSERRLRAAAAAEDPATRERHVAAAVALAQESLFHRPMNAFTWTTLAIAERAKTAAPSRAALTALRQSAALAPNSRPLAWARLEAFAPDWNQLSLDDRAQLLRDLGLAPGAHRVDKARRDRLYARAPFLPRLVGIARLQAGPDAKQR